MIYDIIILTDHRYLNDSTNPYNHNVFYEDDLLAKALKAEGLNVSRKAWDDSHFNWASTKSVIFRTTWDYFDRFPEFSKWLSKVSTQTQLFNSEALLRWNIDKHYLADLERNGVRISKTYFIEKGETKSLKEVHQELEWSETVLKPCVSGAARHTYRLNSENLEQHEAVFSKLIQNEAMMLQPFQHNVVTKGEVSMMVFNGQFSHAILKKAKAGDFRVQDDYGGSIHDYTPTAEEIKFSIDAVKACEELPIYARVDIFVDNTNKIALAELELIEPELWFRNHPDSTKLLAKAIKEKINSI